MCTFVAYPSTVSWTQKLENNRWGTGVFSNVVPIFLEYSTQKTKSSTNIADANHTSEEICNGQATNVIGVQA